MEGLRAGDPPRIGPYRLLGRLGAGGMGQVFLGRSAGGRLVAVKVIRPELAGEPGFRARFEREVAAARNVGGLFTAVVVDADVANGVAATLSQVPRRKTGQTNLVTPWYVRKGTAGRVSYFPAVMPAARDLRDGSRERRRQT
jgi:serine/threonine protein kinase